MSDARVARRLAIGDHAPGLISATVSKYGEEGRFTQVIVRTLEDLGVPLALRRLAVDTFRSPEVQAVLKKRLDEEIETLVRAEVAKRADELEARVRAVVAERFEETVAREARRLMDEEIEKVRRKLT